MRIQTFLIRQYRYMWWSKGLKAVWFVVLWLVASSAGAVPTFDPSDPIEEELAPGQKLTVTIESSDVSEYLTNVYWKNGKGTTNYEQYKGTADLVVPTIAEHCSTISDDIIVEYDECYGDGCEADTSASVLVTVYDPLNISPTSASIRGAPGSTQTVLLQISGGVAPYQVVSESGAKVSFSDGSLSYAIPTDALDSFSDTVIIEGSDTDLPGCGGNNAELLVRVTVELPKVSIVASDPVASKEGADPGEFTVSLSSPAPSGGATVYYDVKGSAAPGEDYEQLSGNVLINGGESSATIEVTPKKGGSNEEVKVIATLEENGAYQVGDPSSATVTITPETPTVLSIEGGNNQADGTGQPLEPFAVKVSKGGNPVPGERVLWTLEKGEGSLSDSESTTDGVGIAKSTLKTSGDGQFEVKATVESTGQSVTFETTTVSDPLSGLPGLTPNQREIGRTIETLCPRLNEISGQRGLSAGEKDLLTQCNALIDSSFSSPGAAVQGVAALTPDQASAPRKTATQITGAQLDNIATRLSALRSGVRGISLRNLTFNLDGQGVNAGSVASLLKELGETGGAASADDGYEFERLGVFVNGNIDWGNKDKTSNEEGFDFKTLGITAGVDYRFAEGLVVGLALGFGNTDVDIDADGGNLDANAWSSTLYGTYYATDHAYVEGSATYGWGNYDQSRNIAYSLLGGAREANADFDGNQYAFMLGTGYDFIRGEGILDVYGRLRYTKADIDGFRETGALGLDLDVAGQEATSFKSILGINYTRSISTAKAVLVPQGWLEWAHEFERGDDEVTGFFANDPSRIPFILATDKFDSDFFRLGVGMGAQFGQGRTAFVSYEAAIGLKSYTEHTANVGVRLDF